MRKVWFFVPGVVILSVAFAYFVFSSRVYLWVYFGFGDFVDGLFKWIDQWRKHSAILAILVLVVFVGLMLVTKESRRKTVASSLQIIHFLRKPRSVAGMMVLGFIGAPVLGAVFLSERRPLALVGVSAETPMMVLRIKDETGFAAVTSIRVTSNEAFELVLRRRERCLFSGWRPPIPPSTQEISRVRAKTISTNEVTLDYIEIRQEPGPQVHYCLATRGGGIATLQATGDVKVESSARGVNVANAKPSSSDGETSTRLDFTGTQPNEAIIRFRQPLFDPVFLFSALTLGYTISLVQPVGLLNVPGREVKLNGLAPTSFVTRYANVSVSAGMEKLSVRLDAVARGVSIGGVENLPSVLDNLVSYPMWGIIFMIVTVTLTAILGPLIKFVVTGQWGS